LDFAKFHFQIGVGPIGLESIFLGWGGIFPWGIFWKGAKFIGKKGVGLRGFLKGHILGGTKSVLFFE